MPYFDHNATTPLAPVAREAWLRASTEFWANPSSPYREAARARLRLDAARDTVAGLLEGEPGRIVFTSGATEAANAIFAHLAATLPATARLAVNPTEHPCVLAAAGAWFPGRIDWLPVDANGVVTPAAVRSCQLFVDATAGRRERVGAVVVMAANNETGVLQPWPELARLCAAAQVPLVCDASQWLGKLSAAGLGSAGWVFGAGHKFGGPKGTGFLHLPPQAEGFHGQVGGSQQKGYRAGTEDVAGISALVAALVEAERRQVMLESARVLVRTTFEQTVVAGLPGTRMVGAGTERLWNTVSLLLPHTENLRWVAKLDARGFQVSTGSACATGKDGPSHVLAAMGVAPQEARQVIRVSAGADTTPEDWAALASALIAIGPELAASSAASNVVKL
ncbi:cysteine desulfurase family protein [Opitutaceae bacterium]